MSFLKFKPSTIKMYLEEGKRCATDMQSLEVGSEEYTEAAKAGNLLAEGAMKLDQTQNVLQGVSIGAGVGMGIIGLLASVSHILDFRPIRDIVGVTKLFKK